MTIHNKLAHANKVLAHVRKLTRAKKGRLYIEAYKNGRENGYTLTSWKEETGPLEVTFSENRNSDHIVVYVGQTVNDAITDKVYESKKLFMPDAAGFLLAAKYVLRNLV